MHSTWHSFLKDEFNKEYFLKIKEFITKERKTKIIYPPKNKIFNAFNFPLNELKIVVLGQDPYHSPNTANGIGFSVNKGKPIPPSLKNIFLELKNEYPNFIIPKHGDLTSWMKQGVLLINEVLTVEEHKPLSHKNIGWEIFTTNVIKKINNHFENIIFVFWGKNAQTKENLITNNSHLILKSAHPSPFSAHRGFFGNNHFIKINEFLKKHNKNIINWQL